MCAVVVPPWTCTTSKPKIFFLGPWYYFKFIHKVCFFSQQPDQHTVKLQHQIISTSFAIFGCVNCSQLSLCHLGRVFHLLFLSSHFLYGSQFHFHWSLGGRYQYLIRRLLFRHGNIKHVRTVDVPTVGLFHLNISVGSSKKSVEF